MNRASIKNLLNILIISITMFSYADEPTYKITPVHDTLHTIELTFNLNEHHFIFKDYITIAADDSAIQLSPWQSSIEPIPFYDTATKTTKKIFNQPVTLTLQATIPTDLSHDTQMQITYYENASKNVKHLVFPLITKSPEHPTAATTSATPVQPSTPQSNISHASTTSLSWSAYLSDLIKTQESYVIRLLLALLLGILLSLTPCIYPMIPITIGILQSQGRSSLLHNVLISCSYTIGVATTFALLGLCAAFTGQLFGSMLTNPIVISCIVALLAYLGGSMLGWYELYLPRWMQQSNHSARGGSCLSAFLFGAVSGTIASPCLSPGLLLLLTIVTTLNSLWLGFALLFTFGIGTSLPLLIIGTFSSSLHLLPRAGMWMIEIKKLFGFILFGMCFYFLSTIISWPIVLLCLTLFMLFVGIYYIYDATVHQNTGKTIKNISGIGCIAFAVLLSFHTYKEMNIPSSTVHESVWLTDYTQAYKQAQIEHKKILVDISAPFCSICKAIDKKILQHADFTQVLQEVIPVKIENAGSSDVQVQEMQKQFNVVGVPTMLLIDAQTNREIKRWGPELYDKTPQLFASEIKEYTQA